MPTIIDIADVQRMVEDGAQLVEVLPEKEYGEEHLPGAINVPLKTLGAEATSRLQLDRPVIVYCSSRTGDRSPR
ncbi:MAG: rhodanese-like domain-containing protein, partial [Chloroflexi bacterium]|nr:rhodanese-like domain-containing protein [Chloroflexota bacterium]